MRVALKGRWENGCRSNLLLNSGHAPSGPQYNRKLTLKLDKNLPPPTPSTTARVTTSVLGLHYRTLVSVRIREAGKLQWQRLP
jgi:hypothetical protein